MSGQTLALVGAAIAVALLLGVALGLALGLYLGERGRRMDAITREVYGQPLARPARIIPQPKTPEERAQSYGHDPKTIERGIEDLLRRAKKDGVSMSRADAEAQVLYMLHPDTMLEGQVP